MPHFDRKGKTTEGASAFVCGISVVECLWVVSFLFSLHCACRKGHFGVSCLAGEVIEVFHELKVFSLLFFLSMIYSS